METPPTTMQSYSLKQDLWSLVELPPVGTIAIFAFTLAGTLTQSAIGFEPVLSWLGMIPAAIVNPSQFFSIADGQWISVCFTLFSYLWFHGNWPHFLANGLAIWFFGKIAEPVLSTKIFVLVYLLTGIVCAFAVAFIIPSSATPIGGSSGAISGMMGASLFFCLSGWIRRNKLPVIIYILEIAIIIALAMWFTFRAIPQEPDLVCSLVWHFVPFFAGWLMMRYWPGFFQAN